MHHIRKYSVAAVAAGMLVAGLMVSSLPASAKATPAPKLKVAPSGGLTNGSTVSVSGSHFTPGDQVFLVECVVGETSTTGSGCNIAGDVGPELVSSKGKFGPVSFKVVTGKIGTQGGTCGTSKADAKACAMSAGDAQGKDSAQKVIKFKVPKP